MIFKKIYSNLSGNYPANLIFKVKFKRVYVYKLILLDYFI